MAAGYEKHCIDTWRHLAIRGKHKRNACCHRWIINQSIKRKMPIGHNLHQEKSGASDTLAWSCVVIVVFRLLVGGGSERAGAGLAVVWGGRHRVAVVTRSAPVAPVALRVVLTILTADRNHLFHATTTTANAKRRVGSINTSFRSETDS